MKLVQLRIFVAVGAQSSISAAAAQLSMSPSSVSAQIKALEAECGLELFVRSHRGVKLTRSGQAQQTYARRALTAADAFSAHAQRLSARVSGSLRLALSVSPGCFDLVRFVPTLNERYPEIKLQVSHEESSQVLTALQRESCDLGIVYGGADEAVFCVQQLGLAELVVAVPRMLSDDIDGSWQSLGSLPWINTGGDCPFHEPCCRLHERHKISPRQVARVNDNRTRQQLVRSGLGLSLLERHEALHPDISIFASESMYCPISLVCLAHRQFEPLIRSARELILRCVRSN